MFISSSKDNIHKVKLLAIMMDNNNAVTLFAYLDRIH